MTSLSLLACRTVEKPASIQFRAAIGPPAKHQSNWNSLTDGPMRGSRGGQVAWTPSSWKNTELYRISKQCNWSGSPEISQSNQASIQYWAIIGPPAKRHSNGVSLAGRWWVDLCDIWILSLPLTSLKKKKRCQRKFDTPWQNSLDLRIWHVLDAHYVDSKNWLMSDYFLLNGHLQAVMDSIVCLFFISFHFFKNKLK